VKRVFFYLAAATILALAAVAVFVPGEQAPEGSAVHDLLLPGLADKINDVRRVDIITAGNTVVATLEKNVDHWQIKQMDGYHADWPKLQKLLAGLAIAKVVEVKTDKPEYYARLGVEDVTSQDAHSVLVKLSGDDTTTGILIGKQAQGRQGQYVRLQNSAASKLLDRTLDVPTALLAWADKRIIDINTSEVAEVEIIHPDGERVFVTKISADQTDFDLVGLPVGREVRSSWAVNSLGSVLSLLDLESVRPVDSVDWQPAVRLRLLTFSGLEIMADMVEVDGDYLVRLNAGHPAAKVVNYQSNADAAADGNEDIVQAAAARVDQQVRDINQRVKGWAYGIPKYKYEALVKKQEDILKPVETS